MKIQILGPNQTTVKTSDGTIFFSYETPVAFIDDNGNAFRTNKKWSKTTSKHINGFLAGQTAEEKEQEFFDSLK